MSSFPGCCRLDVAGVVAEISFWGLGSAVVPFLPAALLFGVDFTGDAEACLLSFCSVVDASACVFFGVSMVAWAFAELAFRLGFTGVAGLDAVVVSALGASTDSAVCFDFF